MRKDIKIILSLLITAALLLSSLTACTAGVKPPSEDMIREINSMWLDQYGVELGEYDKEKQHLGPLPYYGTYHGCVILFQDSILTSVTDFELAGQRFYHGFRCRFIACKDGEIYDLSDAYEQGLLTKRDIAAIAKAHKRYWSRF